MENKDSKNKTLEKEQPILINSNNKLKNIKSNVILKLFFGYVNEGRLLETIKYNKSIQKRINININNYKDYFEKISIIEIEIKPMKGEYGIFIEINKNDRKYYHIFFNDNKGTEINTTKLNKKDKVSKINIIIDYQVTSLSNLFYYCECVEYINFKYFHKNNITDMSGIFSKCSYLKELNLNNFITDNVTNMSNMFCDCSSLKEINLNNFNTNNVTNMSNMFYRCSALKEINLNNLNTNNVLYM